MATKERTYNDDGYNGFLSRSIGTTAGAMTLRDLKNASQSPRSLNFDQMQVSGSMPDSFEVGRILIDGTVGDGRIDGRNANNDPTWRLGDLQG